MNLSEVKIFGISEDLVKEYINKVNNGDRIIAVAGEFSAGKSTFINALLNRKKFLPSANVECTPVLVDLINSNLNRIEVKYNDGRIEQVEATEENIVKYGRNVENYDKSIVGVTIPVESSFLSNNYHIIDTPGTNTVHEEHEVITKGIIRKSDTVLYCVNQSFSESDFEKIKEIRKYTEDIIFILTNLDEEINGVYVNKSREAISRFITEGELDLSNKLGINDGIILPIGSIAAFEDSTLIEEIRGTIKFVVAQNSEKKIRSNAKRQLGVIFEKRLEELIEEQLMSKSLVEIDEEKLSSKIDSISNRINEAKLDDENLKKNFNKLVKENKDKIENQIKDCYKEIEEEILKEIFAKDEIDEIGLGLLFEDASMKINEKLKSLIDEMLNKLIKNIYLENNAQLEEINTDLDIKLNATLHEPSLEELDLTCDNDVSLLNEERMVKSEEINSIIEEVALTKDSIDSLERKSEKTEEEYSIVRNEIISKGGYVPEYDEFIEEGGGSAGKTFGRVLGEVADIALIAFNPSGAVLKTADAVKDGSKIVSYGKKILKGVTNTIKGVKETPKIVNKGKSEKVFEVLDMLSLGGIGEKVGQSLGEAIKPTKVVRVENEEKRERWMVENQALQESKNDIKRRQMKLESDIDNATVSIGESLRRKRELEAELKLSEERERILIARKVKDFEDNNKKQIEEYYASEIATVCEGQARETAVKVNNIVNFATEKILIKSGNEFNNRLQLLEEKINELSNNREDMILRLKTQGEMIEKLKNYEAWINEWI